MPNGSPPSSRPYLSRDPSLVEARGTLRDALGSVQNLDQLLRSLRVGPKALSAVLPDVYESCTPAREALNRLLTATANRFDDPAAVHSLSEFVGPYFDSLQEAIGRASDQPMTARHRLELERTVGDAWPKLDAARGLLDLLEESLSAPQIRLKLSELLSEVTLKPERRDSEPHVEVILEGTPGDVELLVQPQVAMSVFSLGINLNAQNDSRARVTVSVSPDRACTVRFEPNAGGSGQELKIPRLELIPPTVTCIDLAASRMGCQVDRDPDGSAFSVHWRAQSAPA
jgi:hypothetical protein